MKTKGLTALCVLAITIAGALLMTDQPVEADRAAEAVRIASGKINDENPDVRAQAVQDLARANNKDGTRYIMQALAEEDDGPAGYAMAKAVAMLTSQEAHDAIEKEVVKWSKPENLFGAYWCFLGLAQQGTAGADAILRKVIEEETKDKDTFLRAALIEAIAEAGRADMGDLLLPVLKSYDPKWDEKEPIIVTTMVHAAPKLVSAGDKQQRMDVVLALADILEQTEDDRIEWFTCRALSEITGEDTYTDPEFWRFWVQMGGKKVEGRDDGATVAGRDVPKFFKAAAVGKRVVFVIDISGSMQHPADIPPEMKKPPEKEPEKKGPVTGGKSGKGGDDADEEKREIPPPDYSGVKTKLDLAKVELIHTLKYLPDDYLFNIVIYHTPHSMIEARTAEFVRATDGNKRKFIKKVEELNWAELTNIHGALNRAYGINERRSIDPTKSSKRANNPAWDPECLRTGATTIFFLTDGSPTYSDDSNNIGEMRRAAGAGGGGPNVGNGRMVNPNNIVWDIKRLNTFRKVVINTVGIGPHAGGLLEALANMSGGEYIDRSGMAPR